MCVCVCLCVDGLSVRGLETLQFGSCQRGQVEYNAFVTVARIFHLNYIVATTAVS